MKVQERQGLYWFVVGLSSKESAELLVHCGGLVEPTTSRIARRKHSECHAQSFNSHNASGGREYQRICHAILGGLLQTRTQTYIIL